MAGVRARSRRASGPLFVRNVLQLGSQLADPAAVVETADEARVANVAGDIEELFLRDQRSEASEVGIRGVAHDASDDTRELSPLTLAERLAVPGDRDQQSGRGS